MSAIFGERPPRICSRCDRPVRDVEPVVDGECPVCAKLGDRSLIWFIKEMQRAATPEERAELRARFDAARSRSWNSAEREAVERAGREDG